MRQKATIIVFDLVDGRSQLIIGLEVKRFSNTKNIGHPTTISLQWPTDTSRRKFITYITKKKHGNDRLKVHVATQARSTYGSLMANIMKRPELNSQIFARERKSIFSDAGVLSDGLSRAFDKV